MVPRSPTFHLSSLGSKRNAISFLKTIPHNLKIVPFFLCASWKRPADDGLCHGESNPLSPEGYYRWGFPKPQHFSFSFPRSERLQPQRRDRGSYPKPCFLAESLSELMPSEAFSTLMTTGRQAWRTSSSGFFFEWWK